MSHQSLKKFYEQMYNKIDWLTAFTRRHDLELTERSILSLLLLNQSNASNEAKI